MLMQVFDLSNYAFSPYAIPTFLTGAAILLLGLLAIARERGSIVSLLFLLITLTASVWLLSYSVIYSTTSEMVARWWIKVAQLGVIFVPPAVYHFTVVALRLYPEHKNPIGLSWIASGLFAIIMVRSDVFISGVNRYWWGFYADYSWLSFPFLVFFFSLMVVSLRLYWMEYHKALPGTHKVRTKSLLVAFTVGYAASFDYLAAYGIPLYPFGYLPVLGFIVMTSRVLYRYRLVDITPAFVANQIINGMADALLVLDRDGIVRVANPFASEIFGKSERELIGSPIVLLTSALLPTEQLHQLILSGSLRDHEVEIRKAKGIKVFSISSFLMRGQANDPVAIVVIARDITHRKGAEEKIKRQRERQAALYTINQAITSTLDLRSVLNLVVWKVDSLLPYGAAITIRLFNRKTRTLEVDASCHFDECEWKEPRWRSGRDLSQVVFESKSPLFIRNVQTNGGVENPEFCRRRGLVSYLGIPLIAKDEVLGVLSFYTTKEKPFAQEEMEFFITLAGYAAIAIYNARLYEQTQQLGFVYLPVVCPIRTFDQIEKESIYDLVRGHVSNLSN